MTTQMNQIPAIDRGGLAHTIALKAGMSLMEALRDAGLPIAATCGGAKSCATCHVYIENAPDLPDPHEDEIELPGRIGVFQGRDVAA